MIYSGNTSQAGREHRPAESPTNTFVCSFPQLGHLYLVSSSE